jgi:undecaprenyl-diphosphatase
MLDTLLQYDTELFLYLNYLGTTAWDGFWLLVTNKLTFIPLYAVLLFLIYKKYGLKSLLLMIVLITLMITFTDQMTNVVKRAVSRFRPCACEDIMDEMRYIAVRCSSNRSFFSGHASNSMAAAVFGGLILKPFYKHLLIVLVLWSVFVAYSRIYVGVHYPLDVVVGMLFGALSGFMFYNLCLYLQRRFQLI